MSNLKAVTDETFETEIGQHKGFVLVDFWNEGCGPCRMMGPVLDDLAREYAGHPRIAKVDTYEAQETTVSHGVRAVPTLILFKDGQEVDRTIGARNKAQLKAWIEAKMQMAEANAA